MRTIFFRDVWSLNESDGQKLVKLCTLTHAAKLVVRIALFANDVTRYHDYASGSHRGASRTNYSPKWPLAIGMRYRR